MHRYRKENWARKVKDSYPKRWSTSYSDFNINADRHYVHDLGHDPHYVYDREPASFYTTQDGQRHHHYEMPTRATEARTAHLQLDGHTHRPVGESDHPQRRPPTTLVNRQSCGNVEVYSKALKRETFPRMTCEFFM